MNRTVGVQKEPVMQEILKYLYEIKPELHKNYQK